MLESLNEKSKDMSVGRVVTVSVIIFAMFIVLLVRLFNLQLVKSDATVTETLVEEEAEEEYSYYTQYTLPARGNIYDRNHERYSAV